jgi:hypothetical protein
MADSGGHSASELATYGPLAISSAVAIHGARALAVPVTVPNATNTFVIIRVPLCSTGLAVDMTGKSMGFNVRFVTAANSPNLYPGNTVNFALLYTSPTTTVPGMRFGALPDVVRGDSPWVTASGDIFTLFGFSGSVTHAGLMLIFSDAWRGTIYVDDFKIF